MKMNINTIVLLLLATIAMTNAGSLEDDEVTSLPGFENEDLCFKHYAGYLPTDLSKQSNGKNLFYWYTEAVSDPSTKPLILWLNGGPGCSSLGGMFGELGPFVVDQEQNVTLNPFSFNKIANVIFIEQPAGVGFSYPNVPANDTTTSTDTVMALRQFLSMHPELEGRPFYVMGESYGGHYVPNTAKAIQESNANFPSDSKERINLIGFAVGNGYTDWQLDFNANVPNGRFHALTSQSRFEAAKDACDGDYARCFWPRPDVECPKECNDAVTAAITYAEDGSIDIYDIYDDVCLPGTERLETQATILLNEQRRARQSMLLLHAATKNDSKLHHHKTLLSSRSRNTRAIISPIFPTCIDNSVQNYLNRPDVQSAIHVREGTVPNGKWSDCGNVQYDFNYKSEIPNYIQWTQETGDDALEILIYNGDADFILSHMGNSAWINEGLGLDKTLDWTKWHGSDGQVAGYFERYATGNAKKPLTFLTVKGAGHMVPRDRPQHALDMVTKFLSGGNYDEVSKAPVTSLCSASVYE